MHLDSMLENSTKATDVIKPQINILELSSFNKGVSQNLLQIMNNTTLGNSRDIQTNAINEQTI